MVGGLFALATALVLWPPRVRRPVRPSASGRSTRPGRVGPGSRHPVRPGPIALGAGALLLPVAGPACATAAAGVAWTVSTLLVRAVHDRRRRRERADLVAALGMLARDLRAGAPPSQALVATAGASRGAAPAVLERVAAAGLGTGPPQEWLGGSLPMPEVVAHRLAACWWVSHRHGLPLARLVDALRADLQSDVDGAELRGSEAAGPRLSGHLLAALPVLGLLLGAGMGADPIEVLTGTIAGQVLLVVGVALTCVGLLWTDRLVAGPGRR